MSSGSGFQRKLAALHVFHTETIATAWRFQYIDRQSIHERSPNASSTRARRHDSPVSGWIIVDPDPHAPGLAAPRDDPRLRDIAPAPVRRHRRR